MKNVELLAPAGSKESFYASINAGANAVYLGGKLFSARAYASNFSNEELEEMIKYAHLRDVKVYVTVNTIIFEEEFNEVIKFIEFLHTRNVDAILIQDLGLAYYLSKVYPNLVLHASTQLNCHNVSEAKALINLGFKRIVLARETPLSVVKEVKALGVEVEVFVHGALCVSYSGQCLMSSLIGNRSGNRGKCAQPCRNYMVCKGDNRESNNFAISMKDLCTLENIKEYIDAGVDSLKIEGRMKREEYVYEVVSSYRKGLDNLNSNVSKSIEDMKKLFNREFTKGYIFNESRTKILNQKTSSHIGSVLGKVTSISGSYAYIKLEDELDINDGIRVNNVKQDGQVVQKMFVDSKDVKHASKGELVKLLLHNMRPHINDVIIKTTSIKQIEEIDRLMEDKKKIKLDAKLEAYISFPLKLEVSYKDVSISVTSSYIVNESNSKLVDENKLFDQINRIGNTDYIFSSLKYVGQENSFIPLSILNELRREALSKIEEKILELYKVNNDIVINKYEISKVSPSLEEFNLSCQVESEEQYLICKNYPFKKIFINNDKVYFKYQTDERVYHALSRVNELDSNDANNNEAIPYIKCIDECTKNVLVSPYMNNVNSYMLDYLYSNNVQEVILSYELSKNRIINMIESYRNRNGVYPLVSIPLYGYIDLMIMKSCPIANMYGMSKDHCMMCHKNHYVLEDRMKTHFEMMHDDNCNTRILNSLPLYLIDYIDELKSMHISGGILYFTYEDALKINDICSQAFNIVSGIDDKCKKDKTTRGHYLREIE